MNVLHRLNDELLKQPFDAEPLFPATLSLEEGRQIAYTYARIENAIAVLSDLKENRSYIYYGGMAQMLGLAYQGEVKHINSIWEEDIFKRIHPDDLLGKHILELQFFSLLKNIPPVQRPHYHSVSRIRMQDNEGRYLAVFHRMFYIASEANGSVWLALCLYTFPTDSFRPESSENKIVHSPTGRIIQPDKSTSSAVLSEREKEILQLIAHGKTSKEIASSLSISIHTVNRHRQNILEKLRVKNSVEACRLIE